jgi:hypothetical protein
MTLCPRVFQSRKSANIFSRYAPDRPTERRRFNREAGRLRYGSADDLPMICRWCADGVGIPDPCREVLPNSPSRWCELWDQLEKCQHTRAR